MSTVISRDPQSASKKEFDLIIIGGGIYGCMLSYMASLWGLKSLMLEKDDFGAHTSFNSLRIIHGGFRYLQNGDITRLKESSRERRFFLQDFPHLVTPLPCLLPLYGEGLKKNAILRLGLFFYDRLTSHRNEGLLHDKKIPSGKVLTPKETRDLWPHVPATGLKGAVLWYDGFVEDSQLLIMETLKCAVQHGGVHLNYLKAEDIITQGKIVSGVKAKDIVTNKSYDFHSATVINAAGPWCRELAEKFDHDIPSLFQPTLAWNILVNRVSLNHIGLAAAPRTTKKSQAYFRVPWKGKLLIGTGHAPWASESKKPAPSAQQMQLFIKDLNCAYPDLKLSERDILHIFPGLQPANRPLGTELSHRAVIINHSDQNGPKGLYSVSGVKFTTARLVAEKTLKIAFPYHKKKHFMHRSLHAKITTAAHNNDISMGTKKNLSKNISMEELSRIIKAESVVHLDDLVFRRTNLWEKPNDLAYIIKDLPSLFLWDDNRMSQEIDRVLRKFSEKGVRFNSEYVTHNQ